MTGTSCAESGRREIAGLCWLFGAIYFVQGIGDPATGLIAQPVRSLLSLSGRDAAEIALFSALTSAPWALKPLFGVLTDSVPWLGTRRRSYLIASTAATLVALMLLWASSLAPGATWHLLPLVSVATLGVAFSDVVADALMVEKGQPRGITGRLQSIQWAAMYSAMIVAGVLGGYLSERGDQRIGFLVCAGLVAVGLSLAVFAVREPAAAAPTGARRRQGLAAVARSPAFLLVAAFLALWSFNPFSNTVLYVHTTREMQLGEQYYGTTTAILSAGAVVASLAYGMFCRRVGFRALLHVSIVAGIGSTLAYWLYVDRTSGLVVSALVGFTYMTAVLIQLDLTARICPPHWAGTVFASLMAISNSSLSSAEALGGWLYEAAAARWGSRAAFDALVGLGALFTAGCWLLVGPLVRHARRAVE